MSGLRDLVRDVPHIKQALEAMKQPEKDCSKSYASILQNLDSDEQPLKKLRRITTPVSIAGSSDSAPCSQAKEDEDDFIHMSDIEAFAEIDKFYDAQFAKNSTH